MPDNTSPRRLRVFLCHSSGDKPGVRELYHRLREDGFDPWLDEESLLPGQDWQREISVAVRKSDVVVVCISKASIAKTGFIQKELKFALDVAEEQPEGTIFIIPVKLEECEVPERLSRWHWVNLFEPNGYERLTRALRRRAGASASAAPPPNHESKEEGSPRSGKIDFTDTTRAEPPEEPFVEKTRRVDAAVTSHASVNQHIDLLVQVRLPESPPLGLEDWPDGRKKPTSIQQTQADVPLEFPADRRTGRLGSARLMISLVAPDFEVEGEQRKIINVPADGHSRLVKFLLAARRAGECKIDVEVYKADQTYLGTIPLETVVGESQIPDPLRNIASLVLIVAVNQTASNAPDGRQIHSREETQQEVTPDPLLEEAHKPSNYKNLLQFLRGSQGIMIALITASAALITGYWQYKKTSQVDDLVQYTGRVVSAKTQRPVAGAMVSVEAQGPPQIHYTDSNGIFHLKLAKSVEVARIRVEAEGYEMVERHVTLSRVGFEDVRLSPTPTPAQGATPTPSPSLTPDGAGRPTGVTKKPPAPRPSRSPICTAEERLLGKC